ncbi:hypothetical protein [Apibacter sp. HY039]|uniref:hypothetical protein n=1 Tax=Apibacter sp. HY039 TaxID=2501476 RepID=UPI000FEBA158|nr:hypothetical protein [Apibacter sp. HY039]
MLKINKLILGCFVLLFCGWLSAQKVKNKQSIVYESTIKYSNAVIYYRNFVVLQLKKYENVLAQSENNFIKIKYDAQPEPLILPLVIQDSGQRTQYLETYKNISNLPVKNEIHKKIILAENQYASYLRTCQEISDYFVLRRYIKDDDRKLYNSLKDSLNAKVTNAVALWDEVSHEAELIGNEAEKGLLQTSKIAEFVVPMKENLTQVQGIWKELQQATLIRESLSQKNKEFFNSIQHNKNLPKNNSLLKSADYLIVYQDFYLSCGLIHEYVGILLQKVEKADYKSAETYYKMIGNEYDKLVSFYNTFIQQ